MLAISIEQEISSKSKGSWDWSKSELLQMKIQRKYQKQWKLSSQIPSILPGDALCIKNQRKSTKIKENQRKTIYRPSTVAMVAFRRLRWSPDADDGANQLSKAPRCQWCKAPPLPWPEMAGVHLPLLSEPCQRDPRPIMDHTRSLNQTRTNIKASARISKQSKGCGEGALD